MNRKGKYNNQEIIKGIKEKDDAILLFVYEEHYPVIRDNVLRNSGNIDDSLDIFQDAMVVIFNLIQNEKLDPSVSFGAILYSISKHLWLKELRKFKHNTRYTAFISAGEFIKEPEINAQITEMERRKLVLKYFQQLSPQCKQLIAHYIKEIPVSVTTQELGFSSDQYTRNRQSHCKNRLIEKVRSSRLFKELVNGF